MSSFESIKFDEKAQKSYEKLLEAFENLEDIVNMHLANGRAKSLVFTKLEEAHMWCNKGIRDTQNARKNTEMFNSESVTYGR